MHQMANRSPSKSASKARPKSSNKKDISKRVKSARNSPKPKHRGSSQAPWNSASDQFDRLLGLKRGGIRT